MTGNDLRQWRMERLKGTQREAALLLGLRHYAVCRYEKRGSKALPDTLAMLLYLLCYTNVRTLAAQYRAAHPMQTRTRAKKAP